MAGKRILPADQVITNGDMSQPSITQAIPTNIQNMDNVALQLEWTGAPVGTFAIFGSVNGVNYRQITTNVTPPAGSPGGTIVDLNQLSFQWIYVQYTKTSGAGTLNAWIAGKAL
jgi:hypothetical protein